MTEETFSRRDFVQTTAAAGALMFTVAAHAQQAADGPPASLAVIGTGTWGKTILRNLARQKGASVKGVCDTSEPALKAAGELAAGATAVSEYRKLLDDPAISAVVVATPSHLHKPIVLDALAAGKHVYCECPLASSLEEAKAIAQAGVAAKTIFHSGLQLRTNPLHVHTRKLHMASSAGEPIAARAQWHRRESWSKAGAGGDAERAKALNWRLYKETSSGLLGEVGIHQIDFLTWMMKKRPVSVTGSGDIRAWKEDDRDVFDTVRVVFDYPNGVNLVYDATLGNSFDGVYEMVQATQGTLLTRETRAWLFKESDAPLLGWEVYARQDKVGDEQGLVLVANSTKLLEAGEEPSKHANEDKNGALYYALEAFTNAIRTSGETACGPERGYEATVVALTAAQAAVSGESVKFASSMFDLG
ncbi:MAG: Gfo/Idh/MocA family oxidoreductase [Fimbriimonadaceae bacterium]|nr:Gfo/Idh/MocA family oxidoreductase [Fimbriimonadaceae bacterium]